MRNNHVTDLKLVAWFPFSLFFISAVMPLVNQPGVSFMSRHNCNCKAILSWQELPLSNIHAVYLVREPSSNSVFVAVFQIFKIWLWWCFPASLLFLIVSLPSVTTVPCCYVITGCSHLPLKDFTFPMAPWSYVITSSLSNNYVVCLKHSVLYLSPCIYFKAVSSFVSL